MRLVFSVFFLSACAGPSLPLWHADRAEVTIAGHDYVVRHTDQRAEATRVSPAATPARGEMLVHAQSAMEAASGCTIRPGTLYGDRVMAEAMLICPGVEPAPLSPRWHVGGLE